MNLDDLAFSTDKEGSRMMSEVGFSYKNLL